MMDLITVVFRDELPILQVQAQSVDLYCDRDLVHNIYIVVNDHSSVDQLIDTAWWGDYQDRVQIINRSAFGTTWCDNGWVSQQALKLMAGAACASAWSMVLDAKTVFVRPVTADIFNSAGQVQSGQLDIYSVFAASKQIVDQVFGIDMQFQISPGGVPFVFSTETVAGLVQHIQHATGQSFPAWFQQQGRLTEFLLYTGYAIYTGQISRYDLTTNCINPVNICHSETGIWKIKIDSMIAHNPLTVSVHRQAWQQITAQQQQQYRDFLLAQGLTAVHSI